MKLIILFLFGFTIGLNAMEIVEEESAAQKMEKEFNKTQAALHQISQRKKIDKLCLIDPVKTSDKVFKIAKKAEIALQYHPTTLPYKQLAAATQEEPKSSSTDRITNCND